MKIDATVKQIRALLQLAEFHAGDDTLRPEAHRRAEEAARRGVPGPLLDRYQSLFDAGFTPAVVAIERGACSGCCVRLPTMVEYMARRTPAIHICPHCRRMLYAPELVNEVTPVATVATGKPPRKAASAAASRRS